MRVPQMTCPSEAEDARRVVTRLLTAEDYMDARTQHGLPALGVASFRVLTDVQDASVCGRITQIVAAHSSTVVARTAAARVPAHRLALDAAVHP